MVLVMYNQYDFSLFSDTDTTTRHFKELWWLQRRKLRKVLLTVGTQ